MKIISKYKDFYDYMVQDNDADLTYVREPKIVYDYWDDLIKGNSRHITYFSPYYGYQDLYRGKFKIGELTIHNFIFGIYPYVYSQPYVYVHYNNGSCDFTDLIILSKSVIDTINSSNKNNHNEVLNILYKYCFDNLSEYASRYILSPKNIFINERGYKCDIKNRINEMCWKIECKEIFNKLESPVFIKYEHKLIEDSVYNDMSDYEKIFKKGKNTYIHYIINISFQKLKYNILKYWYDEINDLNTYINIENFLWSIKQEPIANPDNNTKILAHGFDLKISFRKM